MTRTKDELYNNIMSDYIFNKIIHSNRKSIETSNNIHNICVHPMYRTSNADCTVRLSMPVSGDPKDHKEPA